MKFLHIFIERLRYLNLIKNSNFYIYPDNYQSLNLTYGKIKIDCYYR